MSPRGLASSHAATPSCLRVQRTVAQQIVCEELQREQRVVRQLLFEAGLPTAIEPPPQISISDLGHGCTNGVFFRTLSALSLTHKRTLPVVLVLVLVLVHFLHQHHFFRTLPAPFLGGNPQYPASLPVGFQTLVVKYLPLLGCQNLKPNLLTLTNLPRVWCRVRGLTPHWGCFLTVAMILPSTQVGEPYRRWPTTAILARRAPRLPGNQNFNSIHVCENLKYPSRSGDANQKLSLLVDLACTFHMIN